MKTLADLIYEVRLAAYAEGYTYGQGGVPHEERLATAQATTDAMAAVGTRLTEMGLR